MKCYKCGSSEEISIKKHDRQGIPIMICRECRREQWRENKRKYPPKQKQTLDELDREIEWREKARASYKLILELRT